jgi:hypothetical protein
MIKIDIDRFHDYKLYDILIVCFKNWRFSQ